MAKLNKPPPALAEHFNADIGGAMRHDWIFDVLTDLQVYAEQNDLPALADQVMTALRVAELEIGGGPGQKPPGLTVLALARAEKNRRTH